MYINLYFYMLNNHIPVSAKKNVLLLFICSLSIIAVAQNKQFKKDEGAPAIGKIKGVVIDNTTKQMVEFATIVLYKLKDSTLVFSLIN